MAASATTAISATFWVAPSASPWSSPAAPISPASAARNSRSSAPVSPTSILFPRRRPPGTASPHRPLCPTPPASASARPSSAAAIGANRPSTKSGRNGLITATNDNRTGSSHARHSRPRHAETPDQIGRDRHHPHLHGRHAGAADGQALHRAFLPGERREGGPHLRLPAGHRHGDRAGARLQGLVLGARLWRFRAEARPQDAAPRALAAGHRPRHLRRRRPSRRGRPALPAPDPEEAGGAGEETRLRRDDGGR